MGEEPRGGLGWALRTLVVGRLSMFRHTGIRLLTDRQWARVNRLFDTDDHVDIHVEVIWAAYQRLP